MAKSRIANLTLWICILAVCLLAGCSTLFAPQEFSENYALADGVRCDAPAVVDGDLETTSESRRIVISLPEAKAIRRVIIHSPNISNFVLYESIGEKDEWRLIKRVKGNKLNKIVVNTQVTTDKIRIFVSDTRGSRFVDPGKMIDETGRKNVFTRKVDTRPIIQEIELYGLVSSVDDIDPQAPLF